MQIIGEKNEKGQLNYRRLKADKSKRIVVLLDGYDEMQFDKVADPEFAEWARGGAYAEANIVTVLSTRPHKTDTITNNRWKVIRCLGVCQEKEHSGDELAHSQLCSLECKNSNCPKKIKGHKIIEALKANKMDNIPLFISMACCVFAKTDVDENTDLDMYTLMKDFYNVALPPGIKNEEQFYCSLGWYAMKSGAVEKVKTFEENASFLKELEDDNDLSVVNFIHPEPTRLMSYEKMLKIARDSRLLYEIQTCTGAEHRFVHTTVAEYAVARLLYKSEMWKIIDVLHHGDLAMVQYFLLMHSITIKADDVSLWKHQVSYEFARSQDIMKCL